MPQRPGFLEACAAAALIAWAPWPHALGEETAPSAPCKLSRAERRAETEKQIKRLKSEVFAERTEAFEILRGFGAEALPQLTTVEPGDDADYAAMIRQLIHAARLGDGQLGEAVGAMLRAYPTQDAAARQQTVSEIVRREGARAVPLLLDLLDNESEQDVQSLIVSKLSYLSPGPDGLKPLLKFYEHAPEEVKGQVLQALAAIPCDESRKLVREALENGTPSLQAWAVQSVQRLNDRACLPALRKLAAGGDNIEQDLQISAISTMTGMLDEEAGPIFRKLLEGSREVQVAALDGLAGIHDRGSAPLLIQLLKDESKKELHEAIVDKMGSIGDPSFVPLLKECVHSPTPSMRISAIGALQAMDARESAAEIDKLVEDEDLDVQKFAVDAVAAFKHKESIPKLQKLLSAADLGLRHSSAKALANLGDPEGLTRLILAAKQYPRAVEEGGETYRSAVDAVSSLGSWQVPEAEELLRELAHDGDENVQWALYQYRFDEQAFRKMLGSRMLGYLSNPARIESELRLAMLLSNRGLCNLAIKHLESAVRRSPNHAQALDRLASAYGEAGRYAECDAAYARLEALEGVNATFLNNRAWFYCTAFSKEFLRPAPSLLMAQRAVALSPHSTYIVDTLGWANHVSGKYDDALKNLRRALDLKEGADLPGIAWERTRIARTLAAMGKKEEALAEAAKALAEAPHDARTLVDAAGFYAAAGERDRAVDCLHKAIDAGWIQASVFELNSEFDALRHDQGYQYAVDRAHRATARMELIVAEVEAAAQKDLKKKHGDEGEPEVEGEVQEGDLFIVD